ncbi:MAG: 3D domain-containing protein [Patescibacteria group bacterium]|nr:3D domain-containing protein [Patescibacteria group bacterium]
MKLHKERLYDWTLTIIGFLILFVILSTIHFLFWTKKASFDMNRMPKFVIFQSNSLSSLSSPTNPPLKVIRKIPVIITAYSSTISQTDSTPFITAAGTRVREGIVANNLLSFGTKIRIPEIYGDRIFVVEDRMNRRKSNYQIDIWFPDYWQALSFGAKRAYIEVLEI